MILAPVASAISSLEPTSSRWPSATTITSTLGKSATLTGLSGFATKGLVRITSPEGAVRRKIDQEKYSSVTGFCCASAAAEQAPRHWVPHLALPQKLDLLPRARVTVRPRAALR